MFSCFEGGERPQTSTISVFNRKKVTGRIVAAKALWFQIIFKLQWLIFCILRKMNKSKHQSSCLNGDKSNGKKSSIHEFFIFRERTNKKLLWLIFMHVILFTNIFCFCFNSALFLSCANLLYFYIKIHAFSCTYFISTQAHSILYFSSTHKNKIV